MYLRLLLIAAVIATVFAATSFTRARVPSEVVIRNNAPGEMHANPMTDHEVHTFIEDLTGRTMCWGSERRYVDCVTGTLYWGLLNAHDGWRHRGSCDGEDKHMPVDWAINVLEDECNCEVVPPYDCTTSESCSASLPTVRVCVDAIEGSCQILCYVDCESYWDAVKQKPCEHLW